MNQPFKFRVWDSEDKTYIKSSEVSISGTGMLMRYVRRMHVVNYGEYVSAWEIIGSKRYIVEHSTGLLDVNNREIYVGDIVKHFWLSDTDAELGIVVSHFGTYQVIGLDRFNYENNEVYITKKYSGNCWHQAVLNESFTASPPVKFGVVGNIRENINLLIDEKS